MRTTEFTEFSYGYALTDSLVQVFKTVLPSAPVFPSLVQEGSVGGGYDLKLPLIPIPLFLQFKIPFVVQRRSSLWPAGYPLPYYRMPLRTSKPNQHQLLRSLEASEPLVFYATPLFHETAELDTHFTSSQVHRNSAYVKPSQLGALDDRSHHLSYHRGAATYWLRSEPVEIAGPFDFDTLMAEVKGRRMRIREAKNLHARRVSRDEAYTANRENVDAIARWMQVSTLFERAAGLLPMTDNIIDEPDVTNATRRLAHFAQVVLGVTLVLLEASDGDAPSAPAGARS